MAVPAAEYESRTTRARALMRERSIDGLVVTDPTTFFYFSGQRAPVRMKQRPSAFVLPLEGEAAIVSWSGSRHVRAALWASLPVLGRGPAHLSRGAVRHRRERRLGDSGGSRGPGAVECHRRDRARARYLAGHFPRGFRPVANRSAQCPVRRVGRRHLGLPDDQVGMGDRGATPGLHHRRAGVGRCLEELHVGITSAEIQKRIVTYYMEEGGRSRFRSADRAGSDRAGRRFPGRRRALSRRRVRFRGLPDGFHAPGGVRRAQRPPAPRARRDVGNPVQGHGSHGPRNLHGGDLRILPVAAGEDRVRQLFGPPGEAESVTASDWKPNRPRSTGSTRPCCKSA